MNELESPNPQWPSPPPIEKNDPAIEFKKLCYQAKLEEVKAVQNAERQKIKDAEAHDYIRGQALYNAYLDVAKAQIDRTQTRATFIQIAASTIGTIYTGILALAFGLNGANGVTPPPRVLPVKGIIPAIFLGLSIVFAAFYLAFITRGSQGLPSHESGLPAWRLREQLDDFIDWTSYTITRRVGWLHSAVVSLGFGVLFLPVAFLTIADTDYRLWFAVGMCIIILLLLIIIPVLRTLRVVTAQDESQ